MNSPEPSQPTPPVAERVRSVDALRGFDMFWILGAGMIVKALEKMGGNVELNPKSLDDSFLAALVRTLSTQLQHVQWEGVRFYDFIFPLFLFIVGVSLVFSLDRTLALSVEKGRAKAVVQIVKRSVLLYLLGIFYTGGLSHRWPDVTLGGVLHRIAACYLFAALIYVWCAKRLRVIAGIAAALLVGYWALLTFVPFPDLKLEKSSVEEVAKRIGSDSPAAIAAAVPERVRGVYEEDRNLANYLDFRFLPGKKMSLYYINEGLLSTLPSIAICLFGIFAGRLLKGGADPRRKVALLFAAGAAGILLGSLWSLQFPLIKRIWTSSFILVASGYSAMMLGLFYYIVDVRKWSRWCEPFVWIGMNPITLYLSTRVINYTKTAEMFVGGDVEAFLDAQVQGLGSLVVATFGLGLVFLLAWFLHRRKIFLRV